AGEAKTLPTDVREATDAEGCTPLHRAVTAGSLSTVNWLLDHGAHLQAVNAQGQTPLHLAAGINRVDIITLFLRREASLSAVDPQGDTALHMAAEAGANQAIVALLKAGATAGLKNKARQTARQLAESQNHTDTVKQLDQTVAELQAAEERELKSQGVLGIFLWKQQQMIRDLQAQNEMLQEQNQTLRNELTQLVRNEIKPMQDWRGGLFTPDREQMIIRLTDREKIALITEQREIKQKEEARQRAEAEARQRAEAEAKRKAEEEEKQRSLLLQNELIAACKQGDEKTVTALLKRGAKPDMPNAKGEQPLGAAVWGMCPDVVNALLKEAKGIAPMTWEECEKHNLEKYKEVFIIPKFDPQTFGEWNTLLQKMDPNPFIRAFHLKKADEQWHNDDTSSWDNLKRYVRGCVKHGVERGYDTCSVLMPWKLKRATEHAFVSYRSQIKQGVESAKRPTVGKNF
ncbi:MAG: ankyrin repeat domain-containing protein, partial [Proteobacteria bacterium]|nr:ankyrin repeat domain-containing protein [Pseudomonadota bacterium]